MPPANNEKSRNFGLPEHLQTRDKFALATSYTNFRSSEVAEVYDETADAFVRHRKNQGEAWYIRNVAKNPIEQGVNSQLEHGGVAMDLHCGSAYLSHLLLKNDHFKPTNIIAVDISQKMLRLGVKEFQDHHPNQNIDFLQASASRLEGKLIRPENTDYSTFKVKDNSVRVAYSLYGFDYTPPKEMGVTFEEIFRVLEPGGRLIFVIPSEQRCQEYYRMGFENPDEAEDYAEGVYLETTIGLNGNLVPKTYLRMASYVNYLVRAGFNIKALGHPTVDRSLLNFNDAIHLDNPSSIRTTAFLAEKPLISSSVLSVLPSVIVDAINGKRFQELNSLLQLSAT